MCRPDQAQAIPEPLRGRELDTSIGVIDHDVPSMGVFGPFFAATNVARDSTPSAFGLTDCDTSPRRPTGIDRENVSLSGPTRTVNVAIIPPLHHPYGWS